MFSPQEPICAPLTPAGTAAINVLRISGSGCIGIVAQFFTPRANLLNSPSHHIVVGTFHDHTGKPLDQVLCSVFRAPQSYTGEDVVELSCHGNPLLSNRILENLLRECRLAQPGEFTLRALLNGKLDLLQAEAVNDLISAPGERAETAALMQVQGLLSQQLRQLLEEITAARLRCELAIDFADQDLPQLDIQDLQSRITQSLTRARGMHDQGRQGRYIREGIRICLAGPPNAGKSSLFNAFLNRNRAIVTPHPGTTRDYLEESISLNGYTLVLYDTAGVRETPDEIESLGVSRTLELMQSADLVLYLHPADQPLPEEQTPVFDALPADRVIHVRSKSDLIQDPASQEDTAPTREGSQPTAAVPVSVLAPGGMNLLQDAILQRLALPREELLSPLITNTRHLAALARCIDALETSLTALQDDAGYEFAAFDLIAASSALEEILGVVTPEDLLQQIFANFCVGK